MSVPSGGEWATIACAALAAPAAVLLALSARRRQGSARHAHQTLACGAGVLAVCAVAVVVGDARMSPTAGRASMDRMVLATGFAAAWVVGMAALLAGVLKLPALAGGKAGGQRRASVGPDGTVVPAPAGNLRVTLRHVLDSVVIAAALWFVGWVLIAAPPVRLPDGMPRGCVPLLVPAATAALAVGLSIVAVRCCPRPRRGMALVGVGVSLVGVAGFGLIGGLCQNWPLAMALGAVAVPVGLSLVAVGSRRTDRPVTCEEEVMRTGTAFAFLPMLALSLAALWHWASDGRGYGVFPIGSGIVLGFALVGRQYLSLLEVRGYARRLKERESHFRELAHTDPLTGLANRRGLLSVLRERGVTGGPPCVLMGMDLDGFKSINDMRGHDVGDQVLVEVGRRLRANLRPGDLAARLGGDEFAVLMFARPTEAEGIAERLLKVLCQPYEQDEGTVFLSASIGLAGCATASDVPTLLRNADLALRFAKQRGKCRVERYDAAYDDQLRRRTMLEHDLRGAIDRGELHLAFQPVVTLPSMRPVGVEALIRWRHAGLGQVSPKEFIPIAEESGMINRLGGWVLHQACHQLSRWLAEGHDVWASVNVSPRELHSPEYVRQVADVLESHRVPPQRLVLEVTEHAVATDLEEMVSRLRALRATGVRIALDDFGAGYSSLGQLRNLPVDILKIDQSLVAEPESSRTGTAAPLVDVVVRLGHRLGLEVIAEGIADPLQLGVVEEAGCRWGQGWLFGAPVPAEHLEALLAAADAAVLARPPVRQPQAPSTPADTPTLPAQTLRSFDSGQQMRQA